MAHKERGLRDTETQKIVSVSLRHLVMPPDVCDIKINPQLWGLVSAERLELSTNGLKGQRPESASSIQWPAIFR